MTVPDPLIHNGFHLSPLSRGITRAHVESETP